MKMLVSPSHLTDLCKCRNPAVIVLQDTCIFIGYVISVTLN
jgi:hypothetical protein